MKADSRRAFTLVEIAIVILLGLIVAGPIVMTLRSGVELFIKTDANAKVTDGVRFTMNSFGRTITPMLNQTPDIKVLLDPVIPDPVPQYMNYVYLDGNAIVHKNSSGDHVLEGSEYISAVNFVLPSSTAESADNFLLNMTLNGAYKTANLEVENKETLFNKPTKDGNNIVSDNFVGNVLVFRTPGYTISPDIDLYDNATMIKINNATMPKGTVILAKYDLNVKRNNADVSATDQSTLEWYVSGSTGANLTPSTSVPDDTTKNDYQYLLVDESNDPYTDDTLPTSADKFYIRTGTDTRTEWIDGGYGIIRARLKPRAVVSSGKVLETDYVWSPYVRIGNKTFWETWLDAIDKKAENEEFSITEIGTTGHITLKATADNKISVVIKSNKYKEDETSVTVARLDYKFMYNDILYSIWKNREDQTSDKIPTLMTMTNYSVMIDAEIQDIYFYGVILSDTPKNDFLNESSGVFSDIGYEFKFQLKLQKSNISGLIIDKYAGSGGTASYNGITNVTAPGINYYHPLHITNDSFSFDGTETWWEGRHRILITILEYYVNDKANPKYIFRVRILKNLSDFSDAARADIKKKDPWFIGPDFYASEPIWFGDFVGSSLTNSNKTVKVRRYKASDPETTVSLSSARTDGVDKKFYGLKFGENSTENRIFRAKEMNIKDNITDTAVKTILSDPKRDRYLGLRVYNHPKQGNNFADALFHEIDIVPGFTADEIRSILPADGKLYEINETIDLEDENRLKITSQQWYIDPSTHATEYNDALFGTNGASDGSGNNGSRYSSTAPGILGLQHVPSSCTCPLENELFKWLDK